MFKLNLMPESMKTQLWLDVDNFYKHVSSELTGISQPCTVCGVCCHFDTSQHRLYASTLEFLYLFEKYQAAPMLRESDVCPFLQKGRCSVRDRRMLGCRTYFRLHTKAERIQAEGIYECHLLLLKGMHSKYQLDWNYQDCMPVFQEEFGLED